MKSSDAVYGGVMRAAGSIAMTAALFVLPLPLLGLLTGTPEEDVAGGLVVAFLVACGLLLFGLCLTWGGRSVEGPN